jgi:flagellar assembly factor FliW
MSQEEFVITFPDGFVGMEGLKEYRLYEPAGAYPLKFLQAVGDESISYPCMDAAAVKMSYQVPLSEAEATLLSLEAPEDALVLVLISLPGDDPREATANLAGPVVINTKTRTGCQVCLNVEVFPLKYPVFASRVEAMVAFPNGLVGYPALTRFRLFEHEGGYPFKFLQSMDDQAISFICMDIASFLPDYDAPMSPDEAQMLALEDPADAMVLAIVVIPKDPQQMTANLAGPVVINLKTCMGRQLVLNIDQYPLKYPVLARP